MTSTEMLQYNYWTRLSTEINNNYPIFKSRKPNPKHYYDLAIGNSPAHISLHIIVKNNEIRSLIRISDNKKLYNYLFKSKDEIEKEMGLKLNWHNLDKNKSSDIVNDDEIDFDNLKDIFEESNENIVDGEEYYKFTWWGKKKSKNIAKASTTKTLRPVKEDSKNWNTTKNKKDNEKNNKKNNRFLMQVKLMASKPKIRKK